MAIPAGVDGLIMAKGDPARNDRLPFAATLATVNVPKIGPLTNNVLSSGLSSTGAEKRPAVLNGEPEMAVSVPPEPTLYASTIVPLPLDSLA